VLRADLDWKECWLLRAMYRWLKQVGFPFAQESVEAALAAQPDAARMLVEIFRAASTPPRGPRRRQTAPRPSWAAARRRREPGRGPHPLAPAAVLDAMLRTNFFQPKDYLAFKLDSALAGEMPRRAPGARSSSIRRAWKAAICAAARWRAAASAGPTGGRISAPRSSA
jgi:glutamate dehydrogenase